MGNIELKDFMKYKFLSGLTYSPDGKFCAILVATCCEEENNYKSNLWLYDRKRESWKKMTQGGDIKSFIWISNTELIFPAMRKEKDKKSLERGEQFTIYYKLDIDGGEAEEYLRVPIISSKIEKIEENIFMIIGKFDNNTIDISSIEGEEKEKAIKTILEYKDYEVFDEIPFWSNGTGIINKKRNRLYLFDKAKDELTPLTDELMDVGFTNILDDTILYTATKYQDIRKQTSGIYRYHLRDKITEIILEDGIYSVSYVDRLDGEVIFIGSTNELYGTSQNPDAYIIKNGKVELLAYLPFGYGNSIGSDCRYGSNRIIKSFHNIIYMIVTEYCESVIKTLNSKGVIATICDGSGSFDGFDVCESGILTIGMRSIKLQEVYFINNGEETQISEFNKAILTDFSVIAPMKMCFRSDGLIIDGFVLRPTNYDPTKKYPAILDIHGGPKATYGRVFYHEMQLWASKGYFVLFCNPRGSDGRGDEFADIRGKYGTIDYNDLMKFTDEVLKEYPQIDETRMAAVGGSYGGFMVNWIIGHTDRFACCASQRSISNWITKCLTTDIGYYHNMDQQASTPWDNCEKMWWHSPLKYANKVKTPTLFIHSDEDYRCWQVEALQMFTALKIFGVESRLCLFHGEDHELGRSGKPLHRVRRLKEMTDWFDHYLKP